MRRDPISILVSNQTRALVARGVPDAEAVTEAEACVRGILEELNQAGLADVYIGVAIRRQRVYEMRCQGNTISAIQERLGIAGTQIKKDYLAELTRRRIAG